MPIFQNGPDSRRVRIALRMSLRGLILIVLVIGGGLGWLVRSARIQREAVAAIRSNGITNSVHYNCEQEDRRSRTIPAVWAHDWLIDRLGVDYIDHVSKVSCYGFDDSDAPLAEIGRLSSLDELVLFGVRVQDGLAHLKGLTSLKRLDFALTDLTDAGLAHLNGLSSLEDLNLSQFRITDAGLVHLGTLKSLKVLNLTHTSVTGDGLEHLQSLPKLEELILSETKVTDAGLAHLVRVTSLHVLRLNLTRITDDGLVHLKNLPRLSELDLSCTYVTGDGLASLRGMYGLRALDLEACAITDTGLEHLSGLPGLTWLSLDCATDQQCWSGAPEGATQARGVDAHRLADHRRRRDPLEGPHEPQAPPRITHANIASRPR